MMRIKDAILTQYAGFNVAPIVTIYSRTGARIDPHWCKIYRALIQRPNGQVVCSDWYGSIGNAIDNVGRFNPEGTKIIGGCVLESGSGIKHDPYLAEWYAKDIKGRNKFKATKRIKWKLLT